MPNRILRDWTNSFKIDELDANAERFFTRLIMVVDDYGRFYADERLLKSNMFPLKPDLRTSDITRWLAECEKAGLIVKYKISNKSYLQIIDFKQALRQKREKFPSPETCLADATHVSSGCIADDPLKRNESESESESESKGIEDPAPPPPKTDFEKFQDWVKANAPSVGKMKEPFTEDEFHRAKAEFGHTMMCDYLKRMHNWNDLKKNKSANLTMRNWIGKDKAKAQQTNIPIYKQGMVR